MAAPGGVSLGPDLLCIAAGAAEDAEHLLAVLGRDARRRVAVLRSAFAADGSPPTPPSALLRPLGHGVVALSLACVRDPVRACLVDEWALPAAGAPEQTAQGVPLPAYLSQRGFVLRLADDLDAAPEAQSAAPQSCSHVLMVAPTAFESNAQAAADNAFMAASAAAARDAVRAAVLAEHAALYAALTRAGVRVRLFAHAVAHGTPDAVFPNNWFSLSRGTLALYPMKCPNRAAERRPELVAWLRAQPCARRVVDLTDAERATPPAALEGTGSLVFDHVAGTAYMARSERCDAALAQRAADALGFQQLHAFDATDAQGRPVYHTNVVMSVGSGFAVVCDAAVEDAAQRAALLASLRRGGRDVVQISREQMGRMCGNVLELRDAEGLPLLALSQRAHDAFTPAQRATLLRHVTQLLAVRIDTLEEVGGGSVRCCIGELFDA